MRTIEGVVLKRGAHAAREREMCAMEAVAWLANERWSDKPSCACPVIAAFVRRFNDGITTDERRTELLAPIVPLLLGTKATPEVERRRAWLAADWAVRVNAPIYLRLVPSLEKQAKALAALPELKDRASYLAAQETIGSVRTSAADAAAAAYAAYAASADADASSADADAYAAYAAYADAYADADADASSAAAAAAYAAYAASADADASSADAYRTPQVKAAIAASQNSAVDLIRRMIAVSEDA